MPVKKQDKIILENFPGPKKFGQYNVGKIEIDDATSVLGIIRETETETHLYSTVETGSIFPSEGVGGVDGGTIGISDMKKGIINGEGARFIVEELFTDMGSNMETEGPWHEVRYAIYYIDGGESNSPNATNSNACDRGQKAYERSVYHETEDNHDKGEHIIDDIICEDEEGDDLGDSFGQTDDNNRLIFWEDESLSTNVCHNGSCGDNAENFNLATAVECKTFGWGFDYPSTSNLIEGYPIADSPSSAGTNVYDSSWDNGCINGNEGSSGDRFSYFGGLVAGFPDRQITIKDFYNPSKFDIPGTSYEGSTIRGTVDSSDGQRRGSFMNQVKAIRGEKTNNRVGYMFLLTRIGGDEKETRGGSRTDERDRSYGLSKIDKSCFAEIMFKTQQHEDYEDLVWDWERSNNARLGSSWFNTNCHRFSVFQDSYGNKKGYKTGHSNDKQVCQWPHGGTFKIKGPKFDVKKKLKSYDNGGANAAYVSMKSAGWWCVDTNVAAEKDCDGPTGQYISGIRNGLNPRYTFDAIGLPDEFKNSFGNNGKFETGQNFLKWNKIDVPYRAISFISASNPYQLDLQNHYEGFSAEDELNKIFSSAPGHVNLNFKLAKSAYDNQPDFVDFTDPASEDFWLGGVDPASGENNFDYWFFVVNWDWKTGDPRTMLQIGDSFPKSTAELEVYQRVDNTYWLHKIGEKEKALKALEDAGTPCGDGEGEWDADVCIDCDTYGEFHYSICSANHTYVTSGMKVIKAVTFRTVRVDHKIPCDSNGLDLGNFRQALDWQVVTMKINLSDKGFLLESDFGDLGGDDFVYLPYPDIHTIRTVVEEPYCEDPQSPGTIIPIYGVTECTDQDYEWNYVKFLESPSKGNYKSSHLVVSGLSENSKYVNSLKKIKNSDPFDGSEGTEKSLLNRSYNLSPVGPLNEIGDFLGRSDLGQIRFFDKPFGMRQLLNIDYIGITDDEFHYHNDMEYWKGNEQENTFSEESPVNNIFIGEYEHFEKNCLVELNMGNLNQKTIRDSSGNSNAGVLIGDFSVKKEDPGQESTRDSFIKIPKKGTDGGAF